MRKTALAIIASFGLGSLTASATDLDLFLTWNDVMDEITVVPGAVISYEVSAILSDDLNLGLAGFSFDLEFDSGDLSQALPGPHMGPFVGPAGFNNTAGFGGMTDALGREGDLVQVGGAQNTINNVESIAPMPIGFVTTGLCKPPTKCVLATGTLTVPETPGEYTLSIPAGSVFANVIKADETGDPFWATEAVGLGSSSHLSLAISVVDGVTVTTLGVFYAGKFGTCVGGNRNGLDCSADRNCVGTPPIPDGICGFSEQPDPSRSFLAPGSTATTANITNYHFGITGIRVSFSHIVDFAPAPGEAFAFEWSERPECVGGSNHGLLCNPENPNDDCILGGGICDVNIFTPVTDAGSAITVTPGVQGGVTLVDIVLADDHVRARWLKVAIDSTRVTASGVELDGEMTYNPVVLPSGDGTAGGDAVFYLGNLPGDADGNRKTELTDPYLIRNCTCFNPFVFAPITEAYDVDKDVKVRLSDVGAARADVNPFFVLPLITP
ncbi:MAG: hypothetical protein JSU86_17755 [Phycisphaerales bacterium]|nr:MAG: hypothetical protein JSU86_17755 [Phycisphaerales bacterium]